MFGAEKTTEILTLRVRMTMQTGMGESHWTGNPMFDAMKQRRTLRLRSGQATGNRVCGAWNDAPLRVKNDAAGEVDGC